MRENTIPARIRRRIYIPLTWDVNRPIWPHPEFVAHFNGMLDSALANQWPTIAQASVYDNLTTAPTGNWGDGHVKPRSEEEIARLDRRVIPDEIEQDIIAEAGGIEDAWVASGHEVFPALRDCVADHLVAIQADYTVGAVLMWRATPSVRAATQHFGIPLIDLELASIRRPFYRDTMAYFQFEPHFTSNEFTNRWSVFQREAGDVPVLTRKEILSLFLNDTNLERLATMDQYEEFEFGAALGLANDIEARYTGCMPIKTVLDGIRTLSPEDAILVRPHPPEQPTFDADIHLDDSADGADFIMRCRRIVSTVSNMGYEAMLYGKTSYVLGPMPFAPAGLPHLDHVDEAVTDLRLLNWITFGFLVPYDLMFSQDYLDWRLSQPLPSEVEIYRRHLEYYLGKWGVPADTLELTGARRLAAFMAARENAGGNPMGVARHKTAVQLAAGQAALVDNAVLTNENQTLKNENQALKNEAEQLAQHVNELLGSTSWRLTAPLRAASRAGRIVLRHVRHQL